MSGVGRARVAAIVVIFGVAASAAGSLTAPAYPSHSTVATRYHAVQASNTEERDAAGSPDFYGNEVTDAMATYKLDGAGDLYEVHSPQTELPRLGSPIG